MPRSGCVLSRLPDGLVMELDLADELQQWFHYLGDYEALEVAFIRSMLPPDGGFLDLGANVGWHTLHAARHLVSGHVYAFEPVEQTREHLRRNLELNGLGNVQVIPFALSDAEEGVLLYEEPGHSGTASMASRPQGLSLVGVSCVRLDDLPAAAEWPRIDVVKMDVEGAEFRALRGMRGALARWGFPPVVCEINPALLGLMGYTPSALLDDFSTLGYLGHRLAPGPRLVPLEGWPAGDEHENVVFTPRRAGGEEPS
jgi:FkbM family methyltransferase